MNINQPLRAALLLSMVTISYNIIEGVVSLYFGLTDETIALFGFGVDSFIEVISAIGVLHLLVRMRSSAVVNRDRFERQALTITALAFFLLAAGLVVGAFLSTIFGTAPETTVAAMAIATLSILIMYTLFLAKRHVGRILGSDALLADANCTLACLYLSIILLLSSTLYLIFAIRWFDILGSLAVAWFAFKEGREAFEKARSGKFSCSCSSH